jgi:hypothetical protein
MVTDLLFYDPATGFDTFWTTDTVKGGIDLFPLGVNGGWRRTWSQLISGRFGGKGIRDLLFYEALSGTGEFHTIDNHGGIDPLESHNWNTTWTQIIPGDFGGPSRGAGLTDLLFYDATNGIGAFFVNDGVGRIRPIAEHTNWRRTWTRIVPGKFSGENYTDLLFYEAASGTLEFHATDGTGQLRLIGQHTTRTTWTQIIPGNFGGSGYTDLLFYDPSSGTGEFYTTDGSGGMLPLQTYTNWRTTWTQIIPGHFGGDAHTDLLFFDSMAATGEFYKTDGHGLISLLTQNPGWNKTWQIVPGMYAPSLGIRVHVKILQTPNPVSISAMINAMRLVYARAGIRVTVASTETISDRPELLNIDVGNCYSGFFQFGDNITGDLWELSRLRNGAGDKDIVLYFVDDIFGDKLDCCAGCAKHPDGRPGAVIARQADVWTVAHEVGHVLGLRHKDDNRDLMFKGGTHKIIDPPPNLGPGDISKMQGSKYTSSV